MAHQVLTAAFKLHHWAWGFLAVLVFGLIKEFIIGIFGKEHDSFMSSLQDFTFCIVGAAAGIIVTVVTRCSWWWWWWNAS